MIFDEFYDNKLRNAVVHSDYILNHKGFRCRGVSYARAFQMSYEELDKSLISAKAFIAAFFQAELLARQILGSRKQQAIPYDEHYKGLMEILVDHEDVMVGFRVHWPNGWQSTYRRTEGGIDMANCMLDLRRARIELFVGLYARDPSDFSPLVERDSQANYTKLEGSGVVPAWPDL